MNGLSLKKFTQYAMIVASLYLAISYFPEIVHFCGTIWAAISSLVIGCVIAYVLNILLVRLEAIYFPNTKKCWLQKSRRIVCVCLSLLLLLGIFFIVINIILPELISGVELIAQEIPIVWDEIRRWGIQNGDHLPIVQEILQKNNFNWSTSLKKIVNVLAAGAGGMIGSVLNLATSAFGILMRITVGLIFALYLLIGKETLARQGLHIMEVCLSQKQKENVLYILRTMHESFTHFIVGQCTEAVILGSLCAIGMAILHFPYAAMTGTIIGVTALIPVAGAYIGGAIGAFMIFTVDPMKVFFFLIYLVVLQQIEGNLIYPRVVGNSIGLPGIWVLAAVIVGGGIFGISGMLLGVPLSATAYKLFREYIYAKISEKNE